MPSFNRKLSIYPSIHNNAQVLTLQAVNISETAFLLRLAVAITSSCLHEFPAATALAVAMVMPFVILIDSSGDDVFSGMSFDWNTLRYFEDKKKSQKGKDKHNLLFPTWGN